MVTPFVMSLIYVYCKKNPEQPVKFLFIFIIKAKYFPFAYMFYRVLQGSSFVELLVGLIVGHLYLYLKEMLPLSTGKEYLKTPLFM